MGTLTALHRGAVLAILENAQWVYALSRYAKKQVLEDEIDVKRLRDRIGAGREADPVRCEAPGDDAADRMTREAAPRRAASHSC